jgi:predicted RNase H-like HicB family nuclease
VSRTLHLTAAVGREGDLFWARCLEVKELVAHGASPQEAVDALAELAAHQLGDLARPYLPHALIVPLDVCLPGEAETTVARSSAMSCIARQATESAPGKFRKACGEFSYSR